MSARTTAITLGLLAGLASTPTLAQDAALPDVDSLGLDGPVEEDEQGPVQTTLIVHARTYSLFTAQRGAALPDGSTGEVQDAALIVERVRPQLQLKWEGWGSAELAYDLLPIVGPLGAQASGFAVQIGNPLRIADLDATLYAGDGSAWALRQNLDRVVVRLRKPGFEVRVGRQAVGHGSARIMPSADLFSPFGPATIDTQFRRGIDGVRVTVPFGEDQEVEAYAFANGTDWAKGAYMARWRASLPELLDISALAGSSYGRPTVALDLTGTALGAAWYAEGSLRADLSRWDETRALRATAGAEYKLPFGLTTTLEVHYNGLGGEPPFTALFNPVALERQVGEVYFLGTWYAALALGYQFHPLGSLSLAHIQSITDGSALTTVSLGWDFAQEVTIGGGLLLPWGARPSVDAAGIVSPGSEFGSYPVVGFTDVRLTF